MRTRAAFRNRGTVTNLAIRALVVFALAGCGASDGEDEPSSATDTVEALTAGTHAPIPFVLQFTGTYRGRGAFDSLDLRRDGSFVADVDGVRKTGRYEGPHAPGNPLRIAFILDADSFKGTITETWTEHQRLAITRGGVTETLTSSWRAGAEDVCDRSGGKWHDDDPDPDTHLDCTCPAPEVYIPSAGGCTN
jgi:hypothetical protein